jgi:hypothetical protein
MELIDTANRIAVTAIRSFLGVVMREKLTRKPGGEIEIRCP